MIPIRLRLTLWYCLLFGLIVAFVVLVVNYSHKQAHYNDIDMILTNISSHVEEEINSQVNNGKALENMIVSTDSLSVNEIAIMIRNENGEIIRTNQHPYFQHNQLIVKQRKSVNEAIFITRVLENGLRFRIKITPIFWEDEIIGYIESVHSLSSIDQTIKKINWMVLAITIFGIGLAAVAGWFLAKKTLSRVDLIGKTAKAIATSQDFEQRVLYTGPRDELGQLTETFNHMLDSLEKAYKNQQIFLSNASHELRAPLTTIRGNLDILHTIKNVPDKEKGEIISDIRNEAIRMSRLVSDLLLLARTDAGQTYQKNIINISDIAKSVFEEMKSRKIDVNMEKEIHENVNIWGDKDSVKQLLIILLENAIKYTSSTGNVLVSIEKTTQQVILQIKDTGIGIRPEERPLVFDRFYRSEDAREYFPDGNGLGLSIAKSIIDEHNASVKLTSNTVGGTTFTIVFSLIKSVSNN